MASVEALCTRIEKLDARVEALEAQLKARPDGGKGEAEVVIDVDKSQEPDPAMDDDLNLVVQPDTDLEGEFRLQPSIWDASLFIGHSHIGLAGSFALALLLLANVAIQGIFCWIAMAHFTKSRYGDKVTVALNWWRSDAHSLRWSQEGMTLVERVCSQDPTLMVGTDVKARIKMITEYLPEFAENPIASGPALSLLALFLWYGIVSKEINGIINFSRSMMFLLEPAMARSMVEPGNMLSVTPPSFLEAVLAVQNLSVAEAHESLMMQLGCDYNGLTANLFMMLGAFNTLAIETAYCHHCPVQCNCPICNPDIGGCAHCPRPCW